VDFSQAAASGAAPALQPGEPGFAFANKRAARNSPSGPSRERVKRRESTPVRPGRPGILEGFKTTADRSKIIRPLSARRSDGQLAVQPRLLDHGAGVCFCGRRWVASHYATRRNRVALPTMTGQPGPQPPAPNPADNLGAPVSTAGASIFLTLRPILRFQVGA
jgi:hypothetical protein